MPYSIEYMLLTFVARTETVCDSHLAIVVSNACVVCIHIRQGDGRWMQKFCGGMGERGTQMTQMTRDEGMGV